ncbi:hypothetical protein [Phyllobacterium endophyticum]|uniref:hypothetical protein n=1 Tax=Phyllobacterium endophyticum TaxID=1149773 RepID=UPI0011CB6E58|nr:hypothetical protein [Phyllobacterium endophyticum]TXR46324.1 hypothetical protein FVA77_25660 [Phyllobacterium endophyticum]
MRTTVRLKMVVLTVVIGFLGLEAGAQLSIPGVSSFVTVTEARVGRPLTPVSVAGAARRTVRRCAAGVYNC